MRNYEAEEYRRGFNAGRQTTQGLMELVRLMELVKLRVVDVLVDGDVPPWIINEAVDAIENAWKEGKQ